MVETDWEVLLPQEIDESGTELLRDFASFTSVSEIGREESELKRNIHKFDAVILRNAVLTKEVIENADKLKIISKHGVGLDNVNIDAATENDIVVCNTPGTNSRAVAEHALTLLFAVNRHLLALDSETRNGSWIRHKWIATELSGKTLGIFGCGDIGQTLGKLADGLGLEVIGYDPYVGEEKIPSNIKKVNKDRLFEESDIVSIHTPLTEETHHAISTPELDRLSSKGILINTARGEIVKEDDLIEALQNNNIRGAGIDVFEEEPPATDNPLLSQRNVIVTPHIAGITKEALRRMAEGAAKHVQTRYKGKMPETTVNKEVKID